MDSFEETDEEVELITIIPEDADPDTTQIEEIITIQLANAGPEGVAVASAVVSSRRHRPRTYDFEINTTRRIRHYKRLMRVLLRNINELSTRVGKQVALVVADVGTSSSFCQVFGAQRLRDAIRNNTNVIVDDLEKAIAPIANQSGSSMIELPELIFKGIPTPVRRMSQIQLRSFIPLMLKYSLGRGQPRWGVQDSKPSWWPRDVPWCNVRTDVRSEAAKKKVSWTRALRQVVVNCYNFHKRIDLMPFYNEEDFRFNLSVVPSSLPENYTTELQENQIDVVQSELDVAGSTTFSDWETKIEYYLDDAIHFKDLAKDNRVECYIDDEDQSEDKNDAVQTEENLDDDANLADEKHNIDNEVQSEEDMGDADLADKNNSDNAIQFENLAEENQIGHYDDNSVQTEEDMDSTVQTGDNMVDAVHTEENMYNAVQTDENMDGAVQTEYAAKQNPIMADMNDADQSKDLAGENQINYYFMVDAIIPEEKTDDADLTDEKHVDNAVQFGDLAEENQIEHYDDNSVQTEEDMDSTVQTGDNMVDAVHTEENMYNAVQTDENMDGAVQTEYPAKQNPIMADMNDADQSKDLAGENQINYYFMVDAIIPEEKTDDADLTDEKHVDNVVQFGDLAEENQMGYYDDKTGQTEENMEVAVRTKNNMDGAVQTEYPSKQNPIVADINDADQSKDLAKEYLIHYYYMVGVIQPEENMDDTNLADEKHVDNAVQYEENMDDSDLAHENHVDNAVQFEYLAEENRTAYYDGNAVQSENSMDDADLVDENHIDNAVQSEENMDDTELADGKHTDNAVESEDDKGDADYNTDGDFESDEDGAGSNDSQATIKIAFRYEENLSITNRNQFPQCDSTQSDDTIGKVCSFQSEEDGVIVEDRLFCDINESFNSKIYPDTTVIDLMDDDTNDEFPDMEEDMDDDLASAFSPAGRFFLRPITAQDEDSDE